MLVDLDMKPENQGEGDKISARHYNRSAREFVADGKVDDAAREAARYIEAEPEDATRAEAAAKRGPHGARLGGTRVSVDELVAKGRTVVERVRPIVERVVDRVRNKISRTGRKV